MTKYTCEDCGCNAYNGACVNCHEEIYIEQQYYDLEEAVPGVIGYKATKQRLEIGEQPNE